MLQIKDSHLRNIDAAAFSSLPILDELFINNNDLRSISHIIFPSSLKRLTSSRNAITSVSRLQFTEPNSNVPNSLKMINLGVNPISNISSDAFSHLSHLDTLLLYNTSLTSIDHVQLPTSLTTLYLTGSPLRRLPLVLASLKNLEHLDLSGIPSLECTCQESALAAWYQARNQTGNIDIRGNCIGGTSVSVVYFLTELAPKCS